MERNKKMKLQTNLKSRKGFTLMELIIVLVIVAILAAALIPSFLNFASRARDESLYAQARVGMVAAQVLITEHGSPIAGTKFDTIFDFENATGAAKDAFNYLVDQDVANPTGFTNFVVAGNGRRIVGLTYTYGKNTVVIGPDYITTP